MMRHVLTLFELSTSEIERIFAIAEDLKAKLERGVRESLLPGRTLALLFEKPSLRTRVSFETGMAQLGGTSLFLGEDVGWGTRESMADFSQVLSQYVDAIVCRAKSQQRVDELATYATCPVINGLTDEAHPCQALADLYTLRELKGSLPGRKLAYVGDANNVARSLAVACGRLGVRMAIAAPKAYWLGEAFLNQLQAEVPELELSQTEDPAAAVYNADGVYTDVWASMGQEAEKSRRCQAFAAYQVNDELMARAPDSAWFLHCLPARRGEEVTDAVIDGPRSAVVPQAANRMHVQKGLLVWLLRAAGAK
jgi:ornithine carbamoyltransferase